MLVLCGSNLATCQLTNLPPSEGFGFERDLAHAMWVMGRALPIFDVVSDAAPRRLDVLFKVLNPGARLLARALALRQT